MEIERLAKIFKALSNEQRLRLFQTIYSWQKDCNADDNSCNCCIPTEKTFTRACEIMDLSKSTISHHFKELQNANLISCYRRGQKMICEINQEIIEEIRNFLD
ncbi:MAG: helix-turn-helix domain-containing protein [Spirochaetes bacterium]|nr:helix-turn-helix domain-containing protein [Spirochaetota bacterium]